MITTCEKIKTFLEEEHKKGTHRLPSERKLADHFQCSRPVIRENLLRFEAAGLVERRHGSGTYLVPNKPEKRLFNIAVVLRRPFYSGEQHFLKVIRSLSMSAEQLNLHLQIFDNLSVQFERSPDDNSLMTGIKTGAIDGVLAASRFPIRVLGRIGEKLPLVLINNNFAGYMDVPSVCCDYYRSGFLAAEHLIKKGHRNIGYVFSSVDMHPEVHMHLSGMNSALQTHGLSPLSEDSILGLSTNLPDRPRQLEDYLRKIKPTAAFIRSDIIAAAVIRMMEKTGLSVPRDLSVIGEGDYSWGGQCDVPLTTMDNQLSAACEMGLKLMRKLCRGETDFENINHLEPKLIERQSVRQLKDLAFPVPGNN